MNNQIFNNSDFIKGLNDYFYLINRNYPEKGSLKLVGDRYKLTHELRTILYRGISSEIKASARYQKLVDLPEDSLIIDGYNVLFTLLNYRLGRFVFICNDGLCRDAGSLHGKIRNEPLFTENAGILTDYLSAHTLNRVIIYLDSPVPSSQKHQLQLNELFKRKSIKGEVVLVKSADESIKHHPESILATSDSTIIDSTVNSITDLPKAIIGEIYGYQLKNLKDLLPA